MWLKFKRMHSFCFFILFLTFLAARSTQASAQDNATLVVYVETMAGDKNFSFVGIPTALDYVQIATQDGGGVKVFDLPLGNYTLEQQLFFDGWVPQDVFMTGTGNWSTPTTAKATFTVSSASDFFYYRVTMRNSFIPENLSLPLLLAVFAVASPFVVLFSKKKRATAPAFAVMMCGLLVVAFIFQAQASPDKLIQLGTSGNDTQVQIGAINKRSAIMQFGFSGNDGQLVRGDGNNVFLQNGGNGNDTITAYTDDGSDFTIQDGGVGNDEMLVQRFGEGNNTITQNGGSGDDKIFDFFSNEKDNITIIGGEGKDTIGVDLRRNGPSLRIEGGAGDDSISVWPLGVWSNVSKVLQVDGGSGNDSFTIDYANGFTFQIISANASLLYKNGDGGFTFAVVNVEQITVIDALDNVIWKNY